MALRMGKRQVTMSAAFCRFWPILGMPQDPATTAYEEREEKTELKVGRRLGI
jgi:hypothetical protein